MDDGLLGVAAAGQQRHRALAVPPAAHRRADLDHFAGAFQPEDRRRTGRRRIEALPLQQIGAIHRRRAHANADVVRPELRTRNLADVENVLVAGLIEDDGAHVETFRVAA